MKIFLLAMLIGACGYDSKNKEYDQPPPLPPPAKVDPWSEEIQGLVKETCALAGCHAGASFLATGESFKASSSLSRIQSGNMPKKSSPNIGLYNDDKKRILLDYLSGS